MATGGLGGALSSSVRSVDGASEREFSVEFDVGRISMGACVCTLERQGSEADSRSQWGQGKGVRRGPSCRRPQLVGIRGSSSPMWLAKVLRTNAGGRPACCTARNERVEAVEQPCRALGSNSERGK